MPRYIVFAVLCLSLAACRPETYVPKPMGYYKVDLPGKHAYQNFDKAGYPYTFQYPNYAEIAKDTAFFGEKPENPYWLIMNFPSLGGTIYMSYKAITPAQRLEKLLDDAHRLSYAHDVKASEIEEYNFNNGQGATGILYAVGGNAATAYQFIVTDSVKNFVRGALYFNVSPNADSLKPVNDFIRVDMEQMLKSWKWR